MITILMIILATIIILICNRAYDNGPVASLASVVGAVTCRAVSAVGWLSTGSVFFGQPWWVMGRSPWPSSAQCHGGGLKRSKLTSPGDGGPKSIMLLVLYTEARAAH